MTGVVKVTNNAFGTLASSISSSATTIALDSGQGARFPTLSSPDYFYGTLIDTSNNLEIVKVTARSTDSLTVTRAQDNTSARAFSTGDRFELRPTAKLFEDIQTNARDLNGQELILDADGDTSITADTDDQIDIKIAGSDRITLTATGITINTGSSGVPAINLSHSNANADNFQITAGTPGVANSGFSIRDVDASANRLVIDASGNATFDGAVNIGTTGSLSNNSGTFLIDANTNLTLRGGVQTFDNADGSTEYMRITSSGNVGIGTQNGDEYPLFVKGSNISSGGGSATVCVLDSGTAYNSNPGGGITFRGKFNSSGSTTNFATVQGIKENSVDGNYDTALLFTTRANGGNLTERMRVDSSGDVTISDGDLILGTNGNGINFSASGGPQGTGSELLDDYEEGTWTPAPYGGTTAGTYTNLARAGRYTKIGNTVWASGYLYGSITGAAGEARVGGLPFSKESTDTGLGTVQWNNCPFNTIGSDEHHPVALVYTDYLFVRASDRVAQGHYTTAAWNNSTISYYRFSVTYRV